MSDISYKQEVELLEAMLEGLESGHHDYEEVVNESIDSVMPIYYTEVVNEWVEAGMPDSDGVTGTILEQMGYSLWESYRDFAQKVITEATDTSSALEIVREALGQRKGYADLAQAIIR
jgi:hypothetical protein